MRLLIFATLFLSVLALLTFYVKRRFVDKLHIKEQYKRYLRIALYINFVGIIGYIYSRYNPNLPNEIFFLLSLPIGMLFLFFCLTLFYDLTHTLLNKTPLKEERREFFKKSLDIGSFVVGAGLVGKSIYQATFIEVEKVDIKIKNLNSNYKIVQLSDVHIGGLIDANMIEKIVNRVNALNPDLVVITGDLVDISLKYATKALDELTKLKSTYGTFVCVGNHEYIHGVDEIMAEVKKRRIRVLENESVYIGDEKTGFNLLGVYDVMGYRVEHHQPDLQKAMSSIKENRPSILLAHQPRYMNELKDENIDLVLSGHTHGGQLYPFRVLISLQQPYVEGLYKHSDKTQVYVNKGTGYWGPPMRLGTSCEITDINLISKKEI